MTRDLLQSLLSRMTSLRAYTVKEVGTVLLAARGAPGVVRFGHGCLIQGSTILTSADLVDGATYAEWLDMRGFRHIATKIASGGGLAILGVPVRGRYGSSHLELSPRLDGAALTRTSSEQLMSVVSGAPDGRRAQGLSIKVRNHGGPSLPYAILDEDLSEAWVGAPVWLFDRLWGIVARPAIRKDEGALAIPAHHAFQLVRNSTEKTHVTTRLPIATQIDNSSWVWEGREGGHQGVTLAASDLVQIRLPSRPSEDMGSTLLEFGYCRTVGSFKGRDRDATDREKAINSRLRAVYPEAIRPDVPPRLGSPDQRMVDIGVVAAKVFRYMRDNLVRLEHYRNVPPKQARGLFGRRAKEAQAPETPYKLGLMEAINEVEKGVDDFGLLAVTLRTSLSALAVEASGSQNPPREFERLEDRWKELVWANQGAKYSLLHRT